MTLVDFLRKFSNSFVVLSNPKEFYSALETGSHGDIDICWVGAPIDGFVSEAVSQKFLLNLKWKEPGVYHLFQFYKKRFFFLDIQTKLPFHQSSQESIAWLNSHCLTEDGFTFLKPEARLLMIYRSIVTKGTSHEKYSVELSQILNNEPGLKELLELPDSDCLSKLSERLLGDPKKGRLKKQRGLDGIVWFWRVFVLALRGYWRRPPLVAFVGLDGAGKSTTVETLLGQAKFKVNTCYWGSRNMLLPTTRLFRFLERKRTGFDIRKVASEDKAVSVSQKKSRPIWKTLLLGLVAINKFFEYYAKYVLVFLYRLKGVLVLNDRFVVDEFLEYSDPFYDFNCWIYRYFFPKPDLIFVMVASPTVIHQRRPSIPAEVAEVLVSDYKKLSFGESKMVHVSSEQPMEQVCELIWGEIFNLWSGK